jgi:capsular polysaccharide export protein
MTSNQGNRSLTDLLASKSVVLLQGPVGPLFGKLAQRLQAEGIAVKKVCFSAGDAFDWQGISDVPVHDFRGELSEWPAFFESLLSTQSVDAVVLFGQARRYHSSALVIAKAKGIEVFVMDEGYFRPGYVTFEANGVNAYSTAMDDADDLLPPKATGPKSSPETVRWHFAKTAWAASLHYLAMAFGRHRYPHYQHHRETSPMWYVFFWVRSGLRKFIRWHKDRTLVSRLTQSECSYFFIPLQSSQDSQIHLHSRFDRIEDFVDEVMESFAVHAPAGAQMLFKEHPMSRGGLLLDNHINGAAEALGISGRVHYVTEAHNPTVLDHCRGVVLINSTLGLQALARAVPVKALGESFFNRPGLTDQQTLNGFWKHPQPPGPHVFDWLHLLKCRTQVPCSVYALRSESWKALA